MAGARRIYQGLADRISGLIWDGEFETLAEHMVFPHTVHHPDGSYTTADAGEMIAAARTFRKSLETLGATAYHRVCKQAAFDTADEDRITGLHTNYVVRGGHYVTEPYPSGLILVRRDGQWKTAAVRVKTRVPGVAYFDPSTQRKAPPPE